MDVDEWRFDDRIQPRAKKEGSTGSSLGSSSIGETNPSPARTGLKRSRSESSLSSLSSEFDSATEPDVDKRARHSQLVSYPVRLAPVSFDVVGGSKVKTGRRPQVKVGEPFELRTVTFNTKIDEAEADIDMPPAYMHLLHTPNYWR